jgi:hypothetical protein
MWLPGMFYVSGKPGWTIRYYGIHDLPVNKGHEATHWLPASPEAAAEVERLRAELAKLTTNQ